MQSVWLKKRKKIREDFYSKSFWHLHHTALYLLCCICQHYTYLSIVGGVWGYVWIQLCCKTGLNTTMENCICHHCSTMEGKLWNQQRQAVSPADHLSLHQSAELLSQITGHKHFPRQYTQMRDVFSDICAKITCVINTDDCRIGVMMLLYKIRFVQIDILTWIISFTQ